MAFSTIQEMKAFCAQHNIIPVGNKSYKSTWQDAINAYLATQAEVVAAAKDAANEAEIVAEYAAVQTEEIAIAVVKAVVAVLTSDEAIAVYRWVLRTAMLTIVFALIMAAKVGRWLWRKGCAIVSQWFENWADSQHGKHAITHLLIGEWVLAVWADAAAGWRDRLAQSWRDRMAGAIARIGLA